MNPHLLLSMIVKNEENRYLERVLTEYKTICDHIVIIDDGSTDRTIACCLDVLRHTSHQIIRNNTSLFTNEVALRKQQWEVATSFNPEWILTMDADERFETSFYHQIRHYTRCSEVDAFYFRMYDMWSATHYREDQYWSAHKIYRPFLVRYKKDIPYEWLTQPLHCGRFPTTIQSFSYQCLPYRMQHLGWSTLKDRCAKYERYKALDSDGKYGSLGQYESILDANPHLLEWEEDAIERASDSKCDRA
ncbi:hypothetical protein A374_05531 [Fictibacillus macauensis ZFHKF-1]|uniref:Glycosyl transferase family 2 n=1 Tax=Fictibacillus macauensis ZFHKF-1 TaxID=1196324 RepID=I8UHL6_9BACL|nr:glycosyltransferase family 2 protein [Fictibacillus macauensis]EIT86400.1 hypothetical protein A374_05531 [Fictibacillus macauensis ZFHKF-1]